MKIREFIKDVKNRDAVLGVGGKTETIPGIQWESDAI